MMLLLKIFLMFLKIGFLGFGGGYAMLSIIFQDSLTLGLTVSQIADLNALDMLIPGPIAINAATYVGYLSAGFWGALAASLAVSVPSFVFVIIFTRLEAEMRDGSALRAALKGVKIGVVGIIAGSVYMLFSELILEDVSHAWFVVLAFGVSLIIQIKKEINPIFLTLIFGVVGYFVYYLI